MPEIKTKDSESQSNLRINLKKKKKNHWKEETAVGLSWSHLNLMKEMMEEVTGQLQDTYLLIETGRSTKGQKQCKCKPIPYEKD